MAWTRTRLEVPEITGDPSVQLATPPPDSGWTPRLGRTVTPDRATKSQGNLFFSGGNNGGHEIVSKSISPIYTIFYITHRSSLQGSLWRERPSEKGRVRVSFCLSPFTLPGGAPAPKIGRSLPPLPPPPVRRHDAPGEAGTRGAPPRHGCRSRRGESVPTRVQ